MLAKGMCFMERLQVHGTNHTRLNPEESSHFSRARGTGPCRVGKPPSSFAALPKEPANFRSLPVQMTGSCQAPVRILRHSSQV